MKRKITLSLMTVCILSFASCGKQETTATIESAAAVESTQVETTVTEETVIAEDVTETSIEQVEENASETEETATTEEIATSGPDQPYYADSSPCGNTQKWQAWDNFCNNWNESDYGTTTKGKSKNDFPYYGHTGYDGSLLEKRTTDKGFTVLYDTATGRVYYTGMTLPTGQSWIERESGSAAVITQYIIDNGLNNIYDITYAEFQELLGTYSGD